MQSVEIYIYKEEVAYRIELFKDEKISINSSITNSNDLGKVFADYSQSFTIPASSVNNKIFNYWYENSIDKPFDHRVRYNAFIEINTVPFRDGQVQLEKVNKKGGDIESYSITFYGNIKQLSDAFKDDKLNTLNYDSLNHEYTGTEVISRITGASSDVCYPLIGNQKRYLYNEGVSTDDITQNAGAILYNDLFPAVKVTDILSFIQTKYDLTFSGIFLTQDVITKLYLYAKNSEKLVVTTEKLMVNFITTVNTGGFSDWPYGTLNLTTNTFSPFWVNPNFGWQSNAFIEIVPNIGTTPYTLFVYNNGVIESTFEAVTGSHIFAFYNNVTYPFDSNYTFYVSSEAPINFACALLWDVRHYVVGSIMVENKFLTLNTNGTTIHGQTTIANINIQNYIPDITVANFLGGLIKMFNLIILPKGLKSFEFMPLEEFYNSGNLIDITQYLYKDEEEINRPKLFKKLGFMHEKSEDVLNHQYNTTSGALLGFDYGDLAFTNITSNESSNYEIKTPFEDVMWERTTDEDFLTASLINKDLKPYTPKPMLIYDNDDQTVGTDIIIYDGSGYIPISNYRRFNNETLTSGTDLTYLKSINFNNEISSWYLNTTSSGLFQNYYNRYITNLYDINTRLLNIKGHLPTTMLSKLKLNDRLVIKDKRYLINTFTTDLTSGEVNFELITDDRESGQSLPLKDKFTDTPIINCDNTAQHRNVTIYLSGYELFRPKSPTGFLLGSYTLGVTYREDKFIDVAIPANTTGVERYDFILMEYYLNGTSIIISIPVIQAA